MSDIGVHSNVYQRLKEYADLVDEVLVGVKSKTVSDVEARRRQLAELLVGIDAAPPLDLRAAWLSMLLGGVGTQDRAEWARLGRALLSPDVDPHLLDRLEELAGRLEQRRVEAFGKLRGIRT